MTVPGLYLPAASAQVGPVAAATSYYQYFVLKVNGTTQIGGQFAEALPSTYPFANTCGPARYMNTGDYIEMLFSCNDVIGSNNQICISAGMSLHRVA